MTPVKCPACHGTGETYSEVEYDDSRWRECEACDGYGIEVDRWSRRAYLALSQEAGAVGWPTHFREDLTVHDRHACEEWGPDQPFAWILRDHGTHMVAALDGPIDSTGQTAWGHIRACFADDGRHRFYSWDGRRLRELPNAEALAEWVRETAYAITHRRKTA